MRWQLYQQAKTWGTRPSDSVGLEGGWVRWDFDTAVWSFGSYVEGQLDEVERKAMNSQGKKPSTDTIVRRKQRTLEKLLDMKRAGLKKEQLRTLLA